MKTYGVVVIGCGHIGCEHLADIYYRDNIRIIAVVDQNLLVAEEAARKYCAEEYATEYASYLEDDRVDIVIVATYTDSHLEIVKRCIEKNKHVLCEKPIANNFADGKAFYDLITNCNVVVQIAHVLRYNSSYKKINEIIKSGEIGELKVIRMVQNHHTVNWERYCKLLEDCTPAVDCGVHYYDILRWFTGSEVAEISGIGTVIDLDSPQLNYTCVNFRMENGCIGFYEAGWSKSLAAQNLKEFIGTKGMIELKLASQRGDSWADGDLITVYKSDSDEIHSYNVRSCYKNMYGQLKNLIDCIEKNSEPNPSNYDVWKSFVVAMAADQAIKTGKKIKL